MEYHWIKGPEQAIELRVMEAISDGWSPLGGPINIGNKVYRGESRRFYAQAMTKENDDAKPVKRASRKKN